MFRGFFFCLPLHICIAFLVFCPQAKGQILDCRRCIDREVIGYLRDLGTSFVISYQSSWPVCHHTRQNFTIYTGKCVLLEFSGKNNTPSIFQADLTAIRQLPYGIEKKLETMSNNLNTYVIGIRDIRVKLHFCKRACPILAKRFAAVKPKATTFPPSSTCPTASKCSTNLWTYLFLSGFTILLLLTSFTITWKKNKEKSRIKALTFYKGSKPIGFEEAEVNFPITPGGQADYLVFD